MMVLRPYQEESVTGIFDFFWKNQEGNPVVGLPTGTGKSVVIAEFIRRTLMWWPQTRILVATHVKELVQQDHEELLSLWPTAPAGIYSAGLKRKDIHYPITFCGIGSVVNATAAFGHIDLILVDECHMVSHKSDTMYHKAILALKKVNPNLRVVGFSASPYRLGCGMITDGGLFTDMCVDYCTMEKFNSLLDAGYMAPLVPKKTETELDTNDVSVHGGEFVLSELQDKVDVDSTTRAALLEAVALAKDRTSWLVFTTGVQHTRHVTDMLNELGISARCVHSQMDARDLGTREDNIKLFKAGHIQALVNYGVLTTGFNHPPLDCIVVLRPTMSPGLWVQMLGRGTRPDGRWGKKDCLVLDFAANTRRLGPINDPVVPKKKGKKIGGAAPYKVCPACQTYNHARARFCICCQAEFPQWGPDIDVKAASDELIRRAKPAPRQPLVPRMETLDVERVEYTRHVSRDHTKPNSLKMRFYCGLRIVDDYLCLEHQGFAGHKARDHWRMLEGFDETNPPETIDEALERLEYLRTPKSIDVLIKPTFNEIIGYKFRSDMNEVVVENQTEEEPF